MSVAEKLRMLRRKSDESLQAVADDVGVSKSHLWELETGKSSKPSLELIASLAEHYKVSVSYLVGEAPDDQADDQQLLVLYRNLKNLSRNDRETLETIIDAMQNKAKATKNE